MEKPTERETYQERNPRNPTISFPPSDGKTIGQTLETKTGWIEERLRKRNPPSFWNPRIRERERRP